MIKICNQYFFSVEGETEEWYLKHLQNLINNNEKLKYKVKFNIKVCKSVLKRAKSIVAPYKIRCFHLCDYESNSEEHRKNFQEVLNQIRRVKTVNKNLIYKLGYSNYAFELWIVNHKTKCIKSKSDRKKYLDEINTAYQEKFKSLEQYKEEKNFKRVINKITLQDVVYAIKNGEQLREINMKSSKKRKISGDFVYFEENPDMTIHECIKEILLKCGMKEKDFSSK